MAPTPTCRTGGPLILLETLRVEGLKTTTALTTLSLPGPCRHHQPFPQTPGSSNQSPILVLYISLANEVPIDWKASPLSLGTLIHPSSPQFQCRHLSEVIPMHQHPSCSRVPSLRLPPHPYSIAGGREPAPSGQDRTQTCVL